MPTVEHTTWKLQGSHSEWITSLASAGLAITGSIQQDLVENSIYHHYQGGYEYVGTGLLAGCFSQNL